ncbi:2-polyprenyl-6-methoxyphenol hydroxylase-like FAD-dependent oxidoreductase [Phyllobacterium myrsinacearum]|uniref:FAD-dependent monooxygenase n=1 Tax=Phyllobacterium myrsinacearum TaxID=28101 RepID=UPI00102A39C2|nr:FAD-dependent monooxygenase [Phyllobacterium myrsinacearum]RZS79824.1 2-polyprenyl-6-methoxyphenol hydroxylase-like FAD-dependent oxidoreductase [Phyllobacterium myrsinacearum]
MSDTYDVVIVGGGPSGLWLAAELKLAGIAVCVLERRQEHVTQSRSLTIHGRTLEVLALRGLADRFLAKGRPIPNWHFAGLPTRLDFSIFEARYPFMLFIPQTQTEALLEARARELGVEIRRGFLVEKVAQGDRLVRVEGAGSEGWFSLEASYVVGADGARSVVRREAGIPYSGIYPTKSIMMADARVDIPVGQPTFSAESPNGGLTILPLGNGAQRVICLDTERSHVHPHEPLSEDELRQSLIRIVGSDLNLRDATWLTRFSDETRLADAYRQGRIFLVGDAAHIHAPMGGQGLNVGLQDAMNLGWKLAAVLKGDAPAALLATYEAERRPVGKRLFNNTLAQSALASLFDPAGRALREIVSEFLGHSSLNHELAGEISGFGLHYPTPLLEDNSDRQSAGLIGQRVPDCDLTGPDGTITTIYHGLESGHWLHLSLQQGARVDAPEWLAPSAIKSLTGVPAAMQMPLFQGLAAMLVRPDGYLAASSALAVDGV